MTERDVHGGAETVRVDGAAPASTPTGGERYVLLERIGEGGMGVVWSARDSILDRTVALKVLHDRFVGAGPQERLASEARAMARLSHRNVVAVYDVGERDGRTYITMELVRGQHLGEWLATQRTWREVVAVIRAAAEGVVAAHRAGIIHRDIKPSNILIGDDGEVRVADFGVASASPTAPLPSSDDPIATTHGFIGTPLYMSPERLRGEPADARSDQFALCVTLYEALHGRRPFAGETIAALRDAIDRGCPAPVRSVPAWLHAVVARGLASNPDERFPSIAALVAALDRRGSRARVWIAGGIGLLAVGAGLAGVLVITSTSDTADDGERAVIAAMRPLTALGHCAYSPTFADNDTVVFDYTVGDAVDLYSVPARGGTPRALVSSPAWEWRATSGRRPGEVAYIESPMDADKKTTVRYLDVATRTTTDPVELETTSIAVANGALYYVDGGSEYVRRRVGTRDEIVGTMQFAESQIAVATTGDLAVVGQIPADRTRLCLGMNSGATTQVCLDDRVREARPAFRSDGRVLYVPRFDGIGSLEVASRKHALVVPGARAGGGIAVSPDGRTLVWSTCFQAGFLVELTASPYRLVAENRGARDPVTGAGGRLAWVQGGSEPRLVVRASDGTQQEVLAGWDVRGAPAFDRRGDRIAFSAVGAQHGVYVTAGDGRASVTRISDGANDVNPMWTSDGRVVFTRLEQPRTTNVYIASPDGGTPVRVRESRTTLSVRHSSDEVLLASPSGLSWWNPSTGAERPAPWTDLGPITSAAISPDGRWLVLIAGLVRSGSDVWRVRLDTGARERVAVLTSEQSLSGAVGIDDDGRIYGMPVEWRGELFAVPLVP